MDREIVVDPGAADNVMPKEMLKEIEQMAAEEGVRFHGAHGSELGNDGRIIVNSHMEGF